MKQSIAEKQTPPRPKKKIARKQKSKISPWITIGVIVVVLAAGLIYLATRPPTPGLANVEDIPVPSGYQVHIPEGQPLEPYPSNPPAGGRHQPNPLPQKFYQDSDLASLPKPTEGYLVHNLEHGYVIFWYNCSILDANGCATLKQQIQQVMDKADNYKVIAFPWTTIQDPVDVTSWGHMLKFKQFNPDQALQYVRQYRGQSPEPTGP